MILVRVARIVQDVAPVNVPVGVLPRRRRRTVRVRKARVAACGVGLRLRQDGVEIQALASSTSFANPRRTANGVDYNRLLLVAAVLTKRVRIKLFDKDIGAKVVGGLTIDEPGMAKTAKDEGFDEIADWFETLAKAERSHANRFQKALDSLDG